MPEAYERCIATKGSKKFTKSLPGGKYIHGCRLPGSKKAVWGEVHKKKSSTSKSPRKYTKSYYKHAYKKSKKG